MKLTQQQLLQAVRVAGAGRESFTCADVREQLGLSTKDRQKLNHFYRAFRTLQDTAAEEFEKLGTNAYRLRVSEPVAIAAEPVAVETIEAEVIELDRADLSEVVALTEPEPAYAQALPEEAAERSEGPNLESTALQGASQTATASVPAWRGHMSRFGRRVRSLFSGRASATTRSEASVGA